MPRRLTVQARHGNVAIDFSGAVISQPTLDLEISTGHGNIVLIWDWLLRRRPQAAGDLPPR